MTNYAVRVLKRRAELRCPKSEDKLDKYCLTIREKDRERINAKKILKGKTQLKQELFTTSNCIPPKINNCTPSNFKSAIFDIAGITSFFIIMSIMFWVTVIQYLCYFVNLIFQSGRRTQLIATILLLLLCASIFSHVIKDKHFYTRNNPPNKTPCEHLQNEKRINDKQCSKDPTPSENETLNKSVKKADQKQQLENSSCGNCNSANKKYPSLCDLCKEKHMKTKRKMKNECILSDKEALEMFKTYKLYSYAADMKHPPSLSTIVDILSAFYSGIIDPIANIFSEN